MDNIEKQTIFNTIAKPNARTIAKELGDIHIISPIETMNTITSLKITKKPFAYIDDKLEI